MVHRQTGKTSGHINKQNVTILKYISRSLDRCRSSQLLQIFRTQLSPAALEPPAPSVKPGLMEGNRPCGDVGLLREWSTPWLRYPMNRPKKGCVVPLGTGKGLTEGRHPPSLVDSDK